MREWKVYFIELLLTMGFISGIILFQGHKETLGIGLVFICIWTIVEYLPNQQKKEHLCYKLRIAIRPKWEEIVPYVPKENKKYPDAFWDKILNDSELEVDKENSLLGKSYDFVVFVDELSGMRQIFSNTNKCFEDKVEVTGQILSVNNPANFGFGE